MVQRLATAFAVVLLATTPVLAQALGRELELGGGWFQFNPLSIADWGGMPSGPSVNLAWTTWQSERTGFTVGVTPVLARDEATDRGFPIYAHFTWRRRWLLSDGQSSAHFGVGAGPVAYWDTDLLTKWSPELQTYHLDGSTETRVRFGLLYHAELLFTRRVREGLDVRAGVTVTPFLYVPAIVQPVVMAVWGF